jgi:hypothetical protein
MLGTNSKGHAGGRDQKRECRYCKPKATPVVPLICVYCFVKRESGSEHQHAAKIDDSIQAPAPLCSATIAARTASSGVLIAPIPITA